MMKASHLGFVFMIFYSVNCQENSLPLAGQDYILRSCISTAELVRTHRKAGAADKMISTNNVAEASGLHESFPPSKGITNPSGREKRRKIEDTPLSTLNIRRASKSQPPLPFMGKLIFPEVSTARTRQQKRQRESEIIIIKPKD
ncbi:uncharacterized protein LOC107045814 [Diachasma alloeum]|uniref:uncharacterized protein LOC107045814 n=1 Tax=Diachasma alloeum TaxID=454923 RepID=UPI0010FAF4C7|nr:uncharacterized protein LOC107045814 [Diachasma alloeum]